MERLTVDTNISFCDIAQCGELPGGPHCPDGSCDQRRVYERLREYERAGLDPEDILRLCDMDRRAKMANLLRLENYQAIGSASEFRDLKVAERKRQVGCGYCDNHAYVTHIEYNVPAHMNYCYACGRDLKGESHE